MSSAQELLKVACSQIGYKSSSTSSKFNDWYGVPGYWCAMFVSWCANKSNNADVIPKHCYTPSGANWFKQRGQWTQGAKGMQPGDIVYFDFPGKPDRISHVGIFERYKNGYCQCVEGNTGDPGGRSGGCVARKLRNPNYIVGYGRPKYKEVYKVAESNTVYLFNRWNALVELRDPETCEIKFSLPNTVPVTKIKWQSLNGVGGYLVKASGYDLWVDEAYVWHVFNEWTKTPI